MSLPYPHGTTGLCFSFVKRLMNILGKPIFLSRALSGDTTPGNRGQDVRGAAPRAGVLLEPVAHAAHLRHPATGLGQGLLRTQFEIRVRG